MIMSSASKILTANRDGLCWSRLLLGLALLVLILLSTALPALAAETWRDSNYPYRREITLENDNMDSALSNFTLLIKLVDGDAVDKDNIAHGRYTFYDSSGTQLDFQNEAYSEGASYVNMETWVEIGTLNADATTTTDDSIWIYYGYDGGDQDDGTGAWNADGNWEGVWHLNETDVDGGAGDIKDSTTNGNDGTTNGGLDGTDQVAGRIGGSIDFTSADNDYINAGSDISIDLGTNDFTLSAWVKKDAFGANAHIFEKSDGLNDGYHWRYQATNQLRLRIDSGTGTTATSDTAISDTGWHHYAVVADRSGNATSYLDGGSDGSTDISGDSGDLSNTEILRLGANTNGLAGLDGILDEARISSTIRTAEWIKYSHANMGGQADNELIVGSEEALGTILLVVPDAASLTAQDAAKKTLMESWGYTVAPISAIDTQANFDAAVATSGAAYVSETINSNNLNTKLTSATIATT